MAKEHVIEVSLGCGRERFMLIDTPKGFSLTPQQRNATTYICRKEASFIQDRLLELTPKQMTCLIKKSTDYVVPVTINLLAVKEDDTAYQVCRQKLYQFVTQD